MTPAFVVRFRPLGPWRIGADTGARDRAGSLLHSDSLFSALCQAMLRLDRLEEWLDATVRSAGGPRVAVSSCFPYLGGVQFVAPPRNLWPPPPSPRVRWANARFVPLEAVRDLAGEQALTDTAWYVDGPSTCLLPESAKLRSGPFRPVTRSHAAVDRLKPGAIEVHRTACIEFAESAGLWAVAAFAGEAARDEWAEALKGAFRLLADSGVGGRRSLGWGRSDAPEFVDGSLPELLLPEAAQRAPAASPIGEEAQPAPAETVYWMLSLFSPAADDTIDWRRGSYTLRERGGRIESPAGSGAEKKLVRMVEEGSVLVAASAPRGAAPDVAPEGFPHPVYRAGFAVSIPIPLRGPERTTSAL